MTRTRLSCDHFLFFDFRTLTFDSLRTPIAALFCDTLSLLYTHFANSFRRTVPRDFPAGHPFYLLLRRPVTLLLSQSHALSITQFIDKTRKQKTKTKTTKQKTTKRSFRLLLRYISTIHDDGTRVRDGTGQGCDAMRWNDEAIGVSALPPARAMQRWERPRNARPCNMYSSERIADTRLCGWWS